VAQARELPGTFCAGAAQLRHLIGIYTWTNTKTGKVYIGSSANCDRRMNEHRSRLRRGVHTNAKLQASWSKHGESAFEFSMIFTVLNRADLEAVEQQFLDDHAAVLNGYNLAPTAGNTFGWVAPPETRARMSEAAKRRDNSLQVEAMRRASTGKKRPPHVVEAIRRAKTGTTVSDETRAKMSLSARNRPERGPEWRERMSQISKAKTRYSQDDRREMARMKAEGMTLREIGERFGACQSLVSRYVREARSSEA
jgi:group I intron endonuclease